MLVRLYIYALFQNFHLAYDQIFDSNMVTQMGTCIWVIVILLFVTLITKVLEGKPETILMVSCDAFSSRFSVNAVLYVKEVILYK